MKNDTQIIKLVVLGLISDGYKIYGDSFIGYRAFKQCGLSFDEFDFNKVYEFDPNDCSPCDALSEACELVKSGGHNDFAFWDESKICY